MADHAPVSLLDSDEYAARVRALLPRPEPAEVPLRDADGLVLGADLRSLVDLPTFDNSAMDGFAVRHADIAAATDDSPVILPVATDIPAGRTDAVVLEPGTAARIMTGSPVPDGADTIVQVEWTDAEPSAPLPQQVAVLRAPKPGQHVRARAEEASEGDVVLPAGTVLTPPALGLAAATGHASVPAYRRPRVLVLSTGSELVPPGEPLAPGQIYESNSVMLVAALQRIGAEARALQLVEDDVPSFVARLRGEIDGADLILTSGGVSAGAYEVVKDALLADGTVEFVKVGMQPGMPQGCGRFDGVPIVTLPGNPVSVYVSFEAFVRPALLSFMGHDETERPGFVGTWQGPRQSSPTGKRQFLRGECDIPAGTVTPVGTPPSHLLASLARSNCLAVVPPAVTELAPGDELEIWLLDSAL